jgi:hypothetical protein
MLRQHRKKAGTDGSRACSSCREVEEFRKCMKAHRGDLQLSRLRLDMVRHRMVPTKNGVPRDLQPAATSGVWHTQLSTHQRRICDIVSPQSYFGLSWILCMLVCASSPDWTAFQAVQDVIPPALVHGGPLQCCSTFRPRVFGKVLPGLSASHP